MIKKAILISTCSLFFLPGVLSSFTTTTSKSATSTRSSSCRALHAANQPQESHYKCALLIDGENATPSSFQLAMTDLELRGIEMPIRRIYGKPNIFFVQWKVLIEQFCLVPVATGHGLADMELALDAMDLLHTKPFLDGFVLMTSDADFIRLAIRLKESDKLVLGVGQRLKTNADETLANACHDYLYTEDMSLESLRDRQNQQPQRPFPRRGNQNEQGTQLQQTKPQLLLYSPQEYQNPWGGKRLNRIWNLFRGFVSFIRVGRRRNMVSAIKISEDFFPSQPKDVMDSNVSTQQPYNNTMTTINENNDNVSASKVSPTSPEMKVVLKLEKSLEALAPNNEWVPLGNLTSHAKVKVKKQTKYNKMTNLIKSHSDRFELLVNGKLDSTCSVRLKKVVEDEEGD